MSLAITGPADLRDQAWLDGRIIEARNGIEAVVDIARNWSEGRGVGRLHPGIAPADYIRDQVGIVGREAIVPLLTESNWSNRQIAAVAGVTPQAVDYHAKQLPKDLAVERPAETLGADGKLRTVSPLRPRLDPQPYTYSQPRTVTATVIDEAPKTPFRVVAQTFERDARRLLDAYRMHLDDERFAARFGAVLAAIESALEEGR